MGWTHPRPWGAGELHVLLDAFTAANGVQRRVLLERLQEVLPGQLRSMKHEGLYWEAVLQGPHLANQLDAVHAEQARLADAVWTIDAADDDAVHGLVEALRLQQRRQAAVLADIWYEEIGGEG